MVGPEWWILALRAIKHLNAYKRTEAGPKPYTATITYPVLSGSSVGIVRANAIFASQAAGVVKAFIAAADQEQIPKGEGLTGSSLTEDGVETGIVSSRLASFTSVYFQYVAPGAHGSQFATTETVDLVTGAPVGLGSLFNPQATWLAVLAADARRQLLDQYAKYGFADSMDYGTTAVASNFQGWSLTPFGLEVSFSAGQVGPDNLGVVSVMLPFSLLGGIARLGGPLSVAAALNPVRMALLPATTLPRVDECYAVPTTAGARHYPTPATCAGGKLNVASWYQLSYSDPALALGANASEARIKAALCPNKDMGLSTVATLAQLGISYYGWPYAALALSSLPKTCSTK
jgi:hypothetical protein